MIINTYTYYHQSQFLEYVGIVVVTTSSTTIGGLYILPTLEQRPGLTYIGCTGGITVTVGKVVYVGTVGVMYSVTTVSTWGIHPE